MSERVEWRVICADGTQHGIETARSKGEANKWGPSSITRCPNCISHFHLAIRAVLIGCSPALSQPPNGWTRT